jgi:23S rRNA pseudouridine1911/1915/1917 synthase
MEIRVPADAAGERLDIFLGRHVGSRSQAQRLLERGEVFLDGQAVAKRHRLVGGEHLLVAEPPLPEAGGAEAVEYRIAYEDEHLLVVDKPAGVVVHPARGHPTGTLSQALSVRGAAGGDEPWRAGIVHRLDRDTSGLLVVAKSETVHRRLREALAARRITREYLVLVDGGPPARSGTIDAPLGRDRRRRTLVSIDTDEPRDARTHFALERALPHASLLRVTLETGRTHQIRAHLRAIGSPVCGDPDYGRPGAYGLDRQFLHAARLAFAHPVSHAPMDVGSPLPADLKAALVRAEAGDGAR